MDGFDFDYWKNLAERDPAAYFRARDDVLRECIPEHPGYVAGLPELQRHIDATRALGGSPLQASRALFGLMEDQLQRLGAALAELRRETEGLRTLLAPKGK